MIILILRIVFNFVFLWKPKDYLIVYYSSFIHLLWLRSYLIIYCLLYEIQIDRKYIILNCKVHIKYSECLASPISEFLQINLSKSCDLPVTNIYLRWLSRLHKYVWKVDQSKWQIEKCFSTYMYTCTYLSVIISLKGLVAKFKRN